VSFVYFFKSLNLIFFLFLLNFSRGKTVFLDFVLKQPSFTSTSKMVREDKSTWKANYFLKLVQLFDEYPKCFLVRTCLAWP